MRQSTSTCSELELLTATSHSSLAQRSARHQSPEVRQGPEAQTTWPRITYDEDAPRALIRAGRCCMLCTSAGHGGRKTLNPIAGNSGLPVLSAGREVLPAFFPLL